MANFDTQQVVLAQPSKYNVPRVVVVDPVTGQPVNLGGPAVTVLTQAEYDALSPKDAHTFYAIPAE